MEYYNHGDKLKRMFNGKSAIENYSEILCERQNEFRQQQQKQKLQHQEKTDVERLNAEILPTAAKAIEEAIKKAIK